MGQQQLLLLVLGIVIVGLAVVVGIQAFGENQKKANSDALVNDGVRIASDVQAWTLKPAAFGGGDGKPTTVSLAKLGYTVDSATSEYTNLNGVFTLTPTDALVTISGKSVPNNNYVTVGVYGTSAQCVTTAIASDAAPAVAAKPGTCTATTGSF